MGAGHPGSACADQDVTHKTEPPVPKGQSAKVEKAQSRLQNTTGYTLKTRL